MKILDCTLRDGGYYTNWDFDRDLAAAYFKSFNQLPVDYLEIGYRSKPLQGYLGEYFYCPDYLLKEISSISNKKLAVMLNEKDVVVEDLQEILAPASKVVEMVRIAVDPKNFMRAVKVAEKVKSMGFEIAFNIMYMSSWKNDKTFLDNLKKVNGLADYVYLVDSYGGVYPDEVKSLLELVKTKTSCKLGFHGHNNLELALINSITALENGADIIDATVTGMGRGAGNLKTELLLTALNARTELEVNFDSVADVVNTFEKYQKDYGWGTNLPYMVSGANCLPQKDVMEWVTKRYYSFNTIIRALQNQKAGIEDNEKFKILPPSGPFKTAIVIGGGPNGANHAVAVREFVKRNEQTCIIHASSKNAQFYKDLNVPQFFCLVGSEGQRLEKIFENWQTFTGTCVLPPFPRKMGTYIPASVRDKCYELREIKFSDTLHDSHTSLALESVLEMNPEEIFLVGYDGYFDKTITQLERSLTEENEFLFRRFQDFSNKTLISITPTNYKSVKAASVFTLLI